MLPLKAQTSCCGSTPAQCAFTTRPCPWRATRTSALCRHNSNRTTITTTRQAQRSTVGLAAPQVPKLRGNAPTAVNTITHAYLHSDGSGGGSSSSSSPQQQLKVVVVGASPEGLATALALARQAGGIVEVHDSRADPSEDTSQAEHTSTLVGLGKCGLEALDRLGGGLPPPLDTGGGGHAVASIIPPVAPSTSATSNLGGFREVAEPLPGLTLLQGLVAVGPQGQLRQETYRRPVSRSNPGASGAQVTTGGVTAGIPAIDKLCLTSHLLSAAAALSAATTSSAAADRKERQLVLPSSAAAATAATGPTGKTPIRQGPTTAPSAEAAQEAAMPAIITTPAPADNTTTQGGSVAVHFSSRLTLVDAANKQATFVGPGGAAQLVSYDLLVAADAGGGGQLVASALQELQDRKAAHKHPAAAAAAQDHHKGNSSTIHEAAELEFKSWQDMPHEPELTASLGAMQEGHHLARSSSTGPSLSSTPQQGLLLVWTGSPAAQQAVHPGLSSDTAIIPGAPSCTVLAWPSKGGTTWSGCVFTYPQVFEALRSQSDYERFLGSASAGDDGQIKLPALWVKGIAAQLKRHKQVGRVPASASAPPHSTSAPSAGLLLLSTAAVPPSHSPQLLDPGVAVGLSEGVALAAHVAAAVATTGSKAATALQEAVQQGLSAFDASHGQEAHALHKLTAQLSWLRHPFSPSAPAAAACVPWGSLAWIGAVLGAPRLGLQLQWKCLLAVLPLVAAVQRLLLYKLGLGRPENSRVLSSASSSAAALSAGGVTGKPNSSRAGGGYSLADVAEAVEPCGTSFLSFIHTSHLPPSSIWRLLSVAPLLASLLWGALFWAAAQALHWGMWAFRAWGWARLSGVA